MAAAAIQNGSSTAAQIALAANAARDPVSFSADLRHPLRFREAISALHDVVASDLRYAKRDKSAYRAWLAADQETARAEVLAAQAQFEPQPLEPGFEAQHDAARRRYWKARRKYERHIFFLNNRLWRQLMPMDPVISAFEDAVLFECFSADESSYGALSVDRAAGFANDGGGTYGTTNVDYSQALYEHFQGLRSYRSTRFSLDTTGFSSATTGSTEHREEKIDLPQTWLRAFLQTQVAMGLATAVVHLDRTTIYGILAWLRRHRERTGPRALRFTLLEGRAPTITIEPWDKEIVCHGGRYDGADRTPIRVWGRRRLHALERLLPLAESVKVHLLGDGLPSFWVLGLGEMTFTLGLSGWTTNDWSRSAALDLLTNPKSLTAGQVERLAEATRAAQRSTAGELTRATGMAGADVEAGLRDLAWSGQVIYDLAIDRYRWRQIMPRAVGEKDRGADHPELTAGRTLFAEGRVQRITEGEAPSSGRLFFAAVDGTKVEMLVDDDGRILRGQCSCSYFHHAGLKRGPCRHLLALRLRCLAAQGRNR